MSDPATSPSTPSEVALTLFPLDSLQHLDKVSALQCQRLLGHGDTFGVWETPEALVPHMKPDRRRIDMRRQIFMVLPPHTPRSATLELLLDEAVLWLTRLALLMRLGPAGLAGTARRKPLDASTVVRLLLQHFNKLLALGTTRRLACTTSSGTGFIGILTAEDLRECWSREALCIELKRLTQLQALGLWPDAPAMREFKGKSTPVRGAAAPNQPERKRNPHPPIPDEYLASMGPRVLWLIKDLGPNLIHLIETLPTLQRTISKRCIQQYFVENIWYDRHGQVIEKPPFKLRHGSDRGKHHLKDTTHVDACEWPPQNWSSVQALAVTLQSAHLWIALLVMAARIGEVATLGRNCVEFAQDGEFYASGRTYKPSRALAGKERDWPLPHILVDVFAQQVRLVEASERLARFIKNTQGLQDVIGGSTHLWASLGSSSTADATEKLGCYEKSLQNLARRLELTAKPGGKNLHPHRFRKTLARLAGLAIDGSQKVLMLLLGHEDVTTTLGYMQTDPAFAKEVHDITRELRVMRGMALIEDMYEAMHQPNSLPYGGHGGGGASVLADSIRAYETELHRTGQEWGVDTARELSVLITNNGESARLVSANVVCTKVAGEVGLCSTKKGAIVAGKCQPDCRNHIEEKTGRRDTEKVIPILVTHAQENMANNNWLPLQHNKKQLEQELKRYDDIGAHWLAKPEVQAIFGFAT